MKWTAICASGQVSRTARAPAAISAAICGQAVSPARPPLVSLPSWTMRIRAPEAEIVSRLCLVKAKSASAFSWAVMPAQALGASCLPGSAQKSE